MELLGCTTKELEQLAEGLGEKAFRGKQLAEWIYRKQANSFADMTNLPAAFREQLRERHTLTRSKIALVSPAPDGTTKYLLELSDGEKIESVLIPSADRVTVCVSTEVGCAAGCVFCATGSCGFTRNLSPGEIIDQVLTLEREGGRRVTNVVYMGMGEPLLNYDNVLHSIDVLNNEVGIAMRKITISTVGITPRIRHLKARNMQLTLALSLHAPEQNLRKKLMPLAEKYPLFELIDNCRKYAEATGRRVTYEYMMLEDVNDSDQHARKLAALLAGSLANVNLIPYNPVRGKKFRRSSSARIKAFMEILQRNGIETTQRMERGSLVSGACGQLKTQAKVKRNT